MPAALEANTIFVRSEIKIIPEPLPVIRMAGNRNRPFFQDGLELSQNITWYRVQRI
jgi:hypothetical protein